MNFPSTLLPQNAEPAEMQKAILDLLAKINQVAGSISGSGAASLAKGYLYGLTLSNGTDANNDIDIAAGECVDSTGAYLMVLAAALTKRLDASWEQGSNGGGLFTGTKAVSTTYHVFVIRKGNGAIDAGYDTDPDAANIPGGWTAFRRIGSVMTDGSGNIIAFSQYGDEFELTTPVLDYNSTIGTSASLLALTVPDGLQVSVLMNVQRGAGGTNPSIYLSCPDATDQAPSVTASPLASLSVFGSGTGVPGGQVRARTNTSSQVRARSSEASTTVRIATMSWIDRRGRDAA